jgi:drug/metabolite transporter (DMT)-like permease
MPTQTISIGIPWFRTKKRGASLGWGALGVAIIASSTSVTFAAALAGALSPLSMLFISEALTMLFTVLSFGLVPILSRLVRIKKQYWMPLVLIGISNSVIAPLLAFTGIRMTGPINAELFIRVEDIVLLLLAVLVLGEKMKRQHIFGAVCVLFGVTIVLLRGFSETMSLSAGDAYILIAAVFYGCGGILYKRYLHHIPPELVVFSRTCIGISAFFLASPFLHNTLIEELKAFPMGLIVALVGYGFISRFLNLFCFYEAMDRLPVRSVSLLLNLGIVASIAFANIYLGTPIEAFHIAGAGFILVGSVLMEIEGLTRHKLHLAAHLKHKHRSHV